MNEIDVLEKLVNQAKDGMIEFYKINRICLSLDVASKPRDFDCVWGMVDGRYILMGKECVADTIHPGRFLIISNDEIVDVCDHVQYPYLALQSFFKNVPQDAVAIGNHYAKIATSEIDRIVAVSRLMDIIYPQSITD